MSNEIYHTIIHEHFLRDVTDHKMTIESDYGVHRCLMFARPGSGTYHFRLITFPGGLTITGDMGTFTFQRIRDMFQFFRGGVSTSYAAEKLCDFAYSLPGGQKIYNEFKPENFTNWITEMLNEDGYDQEPFIKMREDWLLEEQDDDSAHKAYEIWFKHDGDGCDPPDLFSYTFHFLWCLEAIVWGIEQYDNHDANTVPEIPS